MHRVRALAGLALLLLLLSGAGGCDSEPPPPDSHASRSVTLAPGPHPVASLRVEDLGTIRIELLPELAPQDGRAASSSSPARATTTAPPSTA